MPPPASLSGPQPTAGEGARQLDRSDRHRAAVASSTASAHECAARGDYADALSWVAVLDAIGELPSELKDARAAWHHVLRSGSSTISEPLRAVRGDLGALRIQAT